MQRALEIPAIAINQAAPGNQVAGLVQADPGIAIIVRAGNRLQGAAKSFERGDGVVLQKIALYDSRRRGEMIRVDFQRLMAVANRRFVLDTVGGIHESGGEDLEDVVELAEVFRQQGVRG